MWGLTKSARAGRPGALALRSRYIISCKGCPGGLFWPLRNTPYGVYHVKTGDRNKQTIGPGMLAVKRDRGPGHGPNSTHPETEASPEHAGPPYGTHLPGILDGDKACLTLDANLNRILSAVRTSQDMCAWSPSRDICSASCPTPPPCPRRPIYVRFSSCACSRARADPWRSFISPFARGRLPVMPACIAGGSSWTAERQAGSPSSCRRHTADGAARGTHIMYHVRSTEYGARMHAHERTEDSRIVALHALASGPHGAAGCMRCGAAEQAGNFDRCGCTEQRRQTKPGARQSRRQMPTRGSRRGSQANDGPAELRRLWAAGGSPGRKKKN